LDHEVCAGAKGKSSAYVGNDPNTLED